MSTQNTFSYISISPFHNLVLKKMSVYHRVQQHSTFLMHGVVENDLSFQSAGPGTTITVKQFTEAGEKVLFIGYIQDISARVENDVVHLRLTAISNTYLLDIQKIRKSYQDKNMLYEALVKSIEAKYEKTYLIDNFSSGAAIEQYIVQYDETDWEFIARIASRFNKVLIPHMSENGVQVHMGEPQVGPVETIQTENYTVTKKNRQYQLQLQNGNDRITLQGCRYYCFTYSGYIPLGYPIAFNDEMLYISTSQIIFDAEILVFRYWATAATGISTKKMGHPIVHGISIPGVVIDRIRDKVKVHLDIDETQDVGTAWEFPYSTHYSAEGNSGWYCMPELGDTVNIYHPNTEEHEAYAITGQRYSRESLPRLADPDIKYFRTANGKELKFAPDEVLITAKDDETFILMNEDTGITMKSVHPINIITQADLNVTASKKITLNGIEEIELQCQSSKVTMNPNEIKVKSGKIKHN